MVGLLEHGPLSHLVAFQSLYPLAISLLIPTYQGNQVSPFELTESSEQST